MQTEPLRLIINPAASGGRGRQAALEILELLDARSISCDVRYTDAPGHASLLAADAMEAGVGRILVVGGDGTMHEVAGGLLGCGREPLPPVALFPVGTGNDFFRMVGADRSAAAVVRILEEGAVKHFDVGRVRWETGEHIFVNLFGVGVDVEVLRCRGRFSRLTGLAQYLAALVYALFTFRAPEIEIETGDEDRRTVTGRTTLSVITVGPSIGGGFMINPDARAADGLLDLCHVPRVNWLQVSVLVPRVMRGTHTATRLLTMCQLRSARVRRPDGEPLWFEIDGELAPEPARELHVQVIPRALPVMVPAHA